MTLQALLREISPVFPWMFFSCSRIQCKIPPEFSCHRSLVPPGWEQCFCLSLSLSYLTLSNYFVECSSIWFWCFLKVILRLFIFGKNKRNDIVFFSFISGNVISISLITGDLSPDQLVKVMSAEFLQFNICLFVINKYFGRDTLR